MACTQKGHRFCDDVALFHFDDMEWSQFTPVTLGVTAVARAMYG